MSVYVDRLQRWPTTIRCFQNGSCHLFADTTAELHRFALTLGLQRRWAQNCTPTANGKLPHYDLVPSRRKHAVALGAIELDGKPLLDKMNAIRSRHQPGVLV